MTAYSDVQKAKAIAMQYKWGVHGLEYDITNDPINPGVVVIILNEENFSNFNETQRLILTEQVIDLATQINEVVTCTIAKTQERIK